MLSLMHQQNTYSKLDKRCFICNRSGHLARNCRTKVNEVTSREFANCFVEESFQCSETNNLPIVKGTVFGIPVDVLRDTGCTTILVKRKYVPNCALTGQKKKLVLLDGTVHTVPTAKVLLESMFFSGEVDVLVVDSSMCDVVLGNVPGVIPCVENLLKVETPIEQVGAVTTRAQLERKNKPLRPLVTKDIDFPNVNKDVLKQMQCEDLSLQKYFDMAKTGEIMGLSNSQFAQFEVSKGILYRYHKTGSGVTTKQLMLPVALRNNVITLGHDSIMSGHLGIARTCERIRTNFYWPGLQSDVARFCKSCDVCQRCVPKGRVGKAPLQKMPIIGTAFQRISMDLIGPVSPPSERGNRYILTVIDYATRYPEAVALPSIDTERVAEALVQIYSRMGIPSEILTDQGSQFVSELMREIERLLSIKHMVSSPYHPECNGLCEKFNSTLKQMLKKLCVEKPRDWDRYLEPLLFAYREVPQESLGFSPFELLYGRQIRGPMSILRELWTNEKPDEEVKTTYQYVNDLRNRIEETCNLAHESLMHAQLRYKSHFDRKAKLRVLKPGDKVLILLPTDLNKLLMQWKGPFEVLERVGATDYKICIREGRTKIFHINMLKQYFERESMESVGFVTVMESGESNDAGVGLDDSQLNHDVETIEHVNVNPELSVVQKNEIKELLCEFSDVFSSNPGLTDLVEHKVELECDRPIRCKPYPVPFALQDVVEQEIEQMLEMGIIEPSESPYSSPLLLIRKKDNTFRPVIDFRKLNRVTKFDGEPIGNPEMIFAKIASDQYLSKLDFCKGFWQIPVREQDKPKTAFVTSQGLFQFTRLPFGMVNSGASYSRMMRKLLHGLKHVDNFVDDVLTHTVSWNSHLEALRLLLVRVRQAHLTVKPSKCYLGYTSINFLGHVLEKGKIMTEYDKVEKLLNTPDPKTKKDVRSLLGIAGYYRRFIPGFSEVSKPLTDLTKKGSPNIVPWGTEHADAFNKLKQLLSCEPVLKLPDFTREFVLRTDASNVGIGGVLMQKYDDQYFPVMYISKKLLDRERNYSTIERECLAVVWAVEKLQKYLYGREFVLQVDHEPLSYLNKARLSNPRVMRWAITLQPYRFRVEVIKGQDNLGADFLSRVI